MSTKGLECQHLQVKPSVVDQTLGVTCLSCDEPIACCWAEEHVSEQLWNRACDNDETARRCDDDRITHCAICGGMIEVNGGS